MHSSEVPDMLRPHHAIPLRPKGLNTLYQAQPGLWVYLPPLHQVVCSPFCTLHMHWSSGRYRVGTLPPSACGRVTSTHPQTPSTQLERGRTAEEGLQDPWGLQVRLGSTGRQ
jgi:hypothetical protein